MKNEGKRSVLTGKCNYARGSMKTIIIRHRRENLKKCSLFGLEGRPDLQFFTYPIDPMPDLTGVLVLKVGAPPLTLLDASRPLLLIDATWRLAHAIEKKIPPNLEARSIPNNLRTAYPRRQTDCPDPEAGLASIEALFIAHLILGREVDGLLDRYHWKNSFLKLNSLC
jgi:pre-rRNA-processing protein TSR3